MTRTDLESRVSSSRFVAAPTMGSTDSPGKGTPLFYSISESAALVSDATEFPIFMQASTSSFFISLNFHNLMHFSVIFSNPTLVLRH